LGWTELKGSDINTRFKRAWVPQEARVDDEMYPAIVYQFVADEGVPKTDTIISQLDFFRVVLSYPFCWYLQLVFTTHHLSGGITCDYSQPCSLATIYRQVTQLYLSLLSVINIIPNKHPLTAREPPCIDSIPFLGGYGGAAPVHTGTKCRFALITRIDT
jgi:hypothetical protein